MVFYGVAEEIEPEERELGGDATLVGDAAAEDVVEGGDAVGGDEQKLDRPEGRRCREPCRVR